MTQQDVIDFCNQYNYDIRQSHNGRWIDQKCAPDVVAAIADFICNYVDQDINCTFTSLDIWHSEYAIQNVDDIFRKPGVEQESAKNEYDKFFQQPMEMLANARVLNKTKRGHRNLYQVNNVDVLEYIALRERNALIFLETYIEKTLRDSGIYPAFEEFFEEQTKEAYNHLKETYSDFIIENTKINGKVECNRIFIKVLNPLAYLNHSKGTERGQISEQPITYDMLMYNRLNFRDIYADKPRNMTRREYAATHPVTVNENYYHYQSRRAKSSLRRFNEQYRAGRTEHLEAAYMGEMATQMHHIFPEADYPGICYYLENIIALTPSQHMNHAHPNGRTQEIDEQYQHLLLLSKADRVQENLTDTNVETIYEFANFLFVLKVGFDDDDILDIADMDFNSVVNVINVHY
ncbi:MAG: restriction endonuclease [Oscillospiraceae bacterium]|nr:restriction endonuclease [Oscillospiraceae bacterium]